MYSEKVYSKEKSTFSGNIEVSLPNSSSYFVEVNLNGRVLEFYEKEPELYDYLLQNAKVAAGKYFTSVDRNLTVWHINSTAFGGGVAEIIPSHAILMRELGVDMRWLVFQPNNVNFFSFTKGLHNSLHDVKYDWQFSDERNYRDISQSASVELDNYIKHGDIVICHDPQPLGAVSHFLEKNPRPSVWRCHIGYPSETSQVKKSWNFLNEFLTAFQGLVLSTPEYSVLQKRTTVIPPSINPFSIKNSSPRLGKKYFPDLEPFVDIRNADGEKETLAKTLEQSFILQISRWDRLKGFDRLLAAYQEFINNKEGIDEVPMLVLAGPSPDGVADDPEAYEYYNELKSQLSKLPLDNRERIRMANISMKDNVKNAEIVGLLQSEATIVCQLSREEGYGLTLTEALLKGKVVIASDAYGLRKQIVHGVNGYIADSINIEHQVAKLIRKILQDYSVRESLSHEARKRCIETSTQLAQVPKWFDVLACADDSFSNSYK